VSGFLGQTWCEPGTESHRSLMHATLKMAGLHYLKFKGKIMKKVMFIFIGMLISFSASAATLTLTDTGVAGISTITNNNAQYVDALTTTSGNFSDNWGLVANGGDAYVTITVDGFDEPVNSISLFSAAAPLVALVSDSIPELTNIFSVTFLLSEGVDYLLNIEGTGGTGYILSAETPIPAALFLFAPALLGFFGLRRKAALAV
jgi:hypothetical protein